MSFLLFNLVLVGIILFLFAFLSWVWPPDSPWSFWWTTSKDVSRRLCRLAKVKKGDVFYELGSGEGTTVLIAAKEFHARCVGIEIDPMRSLISRVRIFFTGSQKEITILQKNFFHVDFSPATVVYAYLVPKALLRLKEKFLKELRPGTRVVSYKYKIPYLPEIGRDEKAQLYLYEVPRTSGKRQKK